MLSRLPCWADLSAEQYREQVAGLVEEIGAEESPHLSEPHQEVAAVHAASKAARQAFWEAYATFLAAFREALEKLKTGDRTARFPLGSFPPPLPFVSAYPSLPP